MNLSPLAAALAKAQAEFVQPQKNKTVKVSPKNSAPYSFDYADYNAIVEAVRGPLSKYGIAFTHVLEFRNERLVLSTKLIHGESGTYLESIWPIAADSDPKAVGGDMTYGKRYSLSAITGCVADDDLDAEPNSTTEFKPRQAPQHVQKAATSPVKPVGAPSPAPNPEAWREAFKGHSTAPDKPGLSEAQIKRMFAIATKNGYSQDELKALMAENFGITSSRELNRSQYESLVEILSVPKPGEFDSSDV